MFFSHRYSIDLNRLMIDFMIWKPSGIFVLEVEKQVVVEIQVMFFSSIQRWCETKPLTGEGGLCFISI